MNTPGFTAKASLYNGNVRYQSTAEATVYGGLVSNLLNPLCSVRKCPPSDKIKIRCLIFNDLQSLLSNMATATHRIAETEKSAASPNCRWKEFNLQMFGSYRRKFEFLIRCLEEFLIVSLKFSDQLKRPGG
jgi:hypothetical protein